MVDIDALERDGFTLGSTLIESVDVDDLIAGWETVVDRCSRHEALMRHEDGPPYGARHLLEIWPELAGWVVTSPLASIACHILGSSAGLVRGLFFDKPPDHSWALPWHKDLTIAVREHRPSETFTKPTTKAGIAHVEAPEAVLREMVTARLHLDEVTMDNGPLRVLPGSHLTGKRLRMEGQPLSILAARGQVLWMRPMLAHASGHTQPGTTRHRRIIHLEFAAGMELPDGYAWRHWIPLR